MTNPSHDGTGKFIPDKLDKIFDDMDRVITRMGGLLARARTIITFNQRVEDHLMDSLIEIAALGGPAGEVAAEALIVAWPGGGWEDNINVMLTDYARAITPEEWERRKAAGDLNWPHKHQGLDGWIAACDHVEYKVRPEKRDET